MNKRSKIKDTIKHDLSVSMKAARIERQKAKMLKPQLFSENKRKKKDTVQLKIYLKILILIIMYYIQKNIHHQKNPYHQTLKKKRKSFFKHKQLFSIKNDIKVHVLGNVNCLFASLDKLVFNDSFWSFFIRELIVDHIKDNRKDLYADDIEDDFDDYIKSMKNNWERGGIVELLVFSSMIDIKFSFLQISTIVIHI